MRLKIEDMVMFSKVAEKLSFMQAAAELHIPQSTLSRRIRLFEEALNIPLFDRSKRQVTISKEGNDVLEYCMDIVAKKIELELFVEAKYHTNSGVLTIVASNYTSQALSSDFIDIFLESNPNIRIEFKTAYDGYSTSNSDVLITCILPKDDDLVAEKIFSVKKNFFASPSYIEKYGVPKTVDDLLQHKILYVKNPFYPDVVQSYPEVGFDNSNNQIVYSDIHQAIKVAAKGAGVLWVSTYLVQKELEPGRLMMLFDDSQSVELSGYAVYKSRFIQPSKIKSFIEELKSYVISRGFHEE
ncbi:LysR family transcriptional regulator [Plesiomonas sp.]|uniref:LysR family transcriptional regulator n=1 Tax=Plesiomonas sp. TaxID=2486279 RepID=UPI003F2D773F